MISTSLGDVPQYISGCKGFEFDYTTYSSSDSFSAEFSSSALPSDMNKNWLLSQDDLYLSLFVGVPRNLNSWTPDELKTKFFGRVDNVHYDPVTGTITTTGRCISALLVDAKTTEKWVNKTSSQIATILAARHGLTPRVTPTSTPVGSYYQIDHATMTDARTEWDLLTRLAKIERYTVYVRGQTLFFQPLSMANSATPYPVLWIEPSASQGYSSSSAKELKLEKSLAVSRGIIVVASAWNDVAGTWVRASYSGPARPGPNPQKYAYSRHNLSQASLDSFVRAQYAELVAYEMRISVELPGDDALDTTMTVVLSGTETPFDQVYYPDSVKRHFDFKTGYTMTLSAKNMTPETMGAI